MVFNDRLKISEFIGAMVVLLLHSVLIPRMVVYVAVFLGIGMSVAQLNLVCYFASFLLIVLFMHGYLRRSLDNFLDHPLHCLKCVFTALGVCIVLNIAVNLLLPTLLDKLELVSSNPNQTTVETLFDKDRRVMAVMAVLLAPMVEEPIFRGGIFCPLRRRSRVLAYVVTVLIFGMYHIWSYMLSERDLRYLVYILQYIPGGVALCWSYDKSGSIWTAILFHMSYNALSLL